MTNPPALDPFLRRLATRLLAKAERSTGNAPVRLRLDRREAPELYGQTDAEIVQAWVMRLEDLCATGWVLLKLAPAREFASFTDRRPELELKDFDALATWGGYMPQAKRWQRQWLDFLVARWEETREGVPPEPEAVLNYLARNPLSALQELSMEEAARSLEVLRALCKSGLELPLRELSAQVFQGRSKILGNREELLRLLGATPGQFHEAPIQLLVALPNQAGTLDEVIFIENLVTFERMADLRHSPWRHSLLVYAAGFKGSAQRLRSRQGCRLYLRASSLSNASPAIAEEGGLHAVESWLFGTSDLPVLFFGDLDYAGMQILRSLREIFSNAQAWLPGYSALADILEQGGGHLPGLAAKELQNDPGSTGCVYADQRLLPLMRCQGRFIDQETYKLPARQD